MLISASCTAMPKMLPANAPKNWAPSWASLQRIFRSMILPRRFLVHSGPGVIAISYFVQPGQSSSIKPAGNHRRFCLQCHFQYFAQFFARKHNRICFHAARSRSFFNQQIKVSFCHTIGSAKKGLPGKYAIFQPVRKILRLSPCCSQSPAERLLISRQCGVSGSRCDQRPRIHFDHGR